MKIAVYTITKNEAHFIPRWAESCTEADYRLIVDTGSTDSTVEVARASGCNVDFITIRPWRFDDARNASLALLPDDIDLCIALDADEVLAPGWRQALEQVPPHVTRPRYKYVWSWNHNGSEGLTYSGDKIHARWNYRWKHPVHEVIICTAEEVQGWCDLQIHHHPDPSKSRSQYLPLLEQAVQEDPNDDRNRFYLGRELMFNGRNPEAEVHLRKHLELSGWKAERATCMRYLSRVTGDREHWLLRACGEAPDRREPWVELAQFYYGEKRWWQSLSCALRALDITVKPLEYLCEAEAWGALPYDLATIAAWNVGLKADAIKYSAKALSFNPSDTRLRSNHALMLSLLGQRQVDVVIPTKSNIGGLTKILEVLKTAKAIGSVCVVADGDDAYGNLKSLVDNKSIYLEKVSEGSGIHAMWNLGMSISPGFNHILFLNDDVEINLDTVALLSSQLDADDSIGLICPNYDGRQIVLPAVEANGTCRGRYDGSGGIAGFCMMLRAELRNQWRFDERMKWWYGDDDLVRWVSDIQGKGTVISGIATCSNNSSWTIENDPPQDFALIVENDRRLHNLKWGLDA
jgi:glycosyltransferase involved in cell wall biosynthesis